MVAHSSRLESTAAYDCHDCAGLGREIPRLFDKRIRMVPGHSSQSRMEANVLYEEEEAGLIDARLLLQYVSIPTLIRFDLRRWQRIPIFRALAFGQFAPSTSCLSLSEPSVIRLHLWEEADLALT
ncbi:hypothetical protein AXG93_1923s1460 [Marchantia polymorpha subsp. ruderalis]|uniref:Uncharacterized protein n=1 Tax=Marchantia polymorpha subsp. ruderalis TaxID=1480154 RepID=A0A176VCL5_MARPO|nr:hypothetical protein AXG93_1923s1460 [Marchantia polymorpha subsp. ruderalis]